VAGESLASVVTKRRRVAENMAKNVAQIVAKAGTLCRRSGFDTEAKVGMLPSSQPPGLGFHTEAGRAISSVGAGSSMRHD
jgi:hypothetical protein